MRYSERCSDLTTRWESSNSTCVPCPFKEGREVTPNCGFDDDGGNHELPTTPCKNDTYNDGRWAKCQPCSQCVDGYRLVSPCSRIADAVCAEAVPSIHTRQAVLWAVPFAVAVSILLAVLCVIHVKRKRGLSRRAPVFNINTSYSSEGFSSPASLIRNPDETLCPTILSAPLQTVLDNLDVLEELVILLDPESHGVKNTKHLASLCAFPSTWITYTYSMKDNKSPLKAVLEGITSKHPDWTVGHLAKMLKAIERQDAIAVLARLRLNKMAV